MTIRLILGDQLNPLHAWFAQPDPQILYVMMETRSETDYAVHHIQKVVGFFAAMRLFAGSLEAAGHRVRYFRLDDPDNLQTFEANIRSLIRSERAHRWEYQLPDEWRLDRELAALGDALRREGVTVGVWDTEHFMTQRTELADMFRGKKAFLMETFYRKIRIKHGILMEPDGQTPLTGRWNYDAENRKKLPKNEVIPPAPGFGRDLSDLTRMIRDAGVRTIGSIRPQAFDWPLTREEGLQVLQDFNRLRLARFGDYQDAMSERDWLLFHSRLSFSLNLKMISPAEVIQSAIAHWRRRPDQVSIAAVEGFVRQIAGWREYMRGIYWAKMPEYATLNFFDHQAPLPRWYWSGETRMNCLRQAVTQSLEHAYAHHIQRLMLTGNFALLLGVAPDEVDAWYLGIYIDAIEWVEITNTRGMSQYADGGIVGSKPYVSSANYIHKMSDHCARCHYAHNLRHGPRACPFNSLYWDFYHRHRSTLERNPRIGMAYRLWDTMPDDERRQILLQAETYKRQADEL
ncbi:MAG: cryptochrome/photolyase family protein [Saprospiraceae bacterium]